MWGAYADGLTHREGRVWSLDLGVVMVDELLNHLDRLILQLFVSRRGYFLDLLEEVHSDVLVAVGLENFTSDLAAFKTCGMDEVAVFTPGAAVGSVIVATRNGAEVAWLDDLIHVCGCLLGVNLLKLSHLSFALLINFFELDDGIIS